MNEEDRNISLKKSHVPLMTSSSRERKTGKGGGVRIGGQGGREAAKNILHKG